MPKNVAYLGVLALLQFVSAAAGFGQSSAPQRDHFASVGRLLSQLQWHDEASHGGYLAKRDEVMRSLWREIDGLVSDSFRPSAATTKLVKAKLNALLGYQGRPGDTLRTNTAFFVTLPKGRFLVVGVEVPRGGPAIAEDEISYRAYRDDGQQFTFVSAVEDLHSSDASSPFALGMYTLPLVPAPVVGESWFIALTEIPPQSPPTVAMRLYAFDGENFRTVWSPKDFMVESADKAVDVKNGGLIVNSLFDPTGQAAHSPGVVVHQQYVLTVEGPKKVAEWQTNRQ